MPNKRKYIGTEYGMVNLRDGDTILHLDPEILVDIYWRVFDGELAEVVRCKDCRYWSNNECIYCYFEDNPNGYCAWGERREDAKTD